MRRASPDRIYEAQRTGLRNRIRDAWRIAEARADALLLAWEAEAASRGLEHHDPQYWSQAETWVEGQIRRT